MVKPNEPQGYVHTKIITDTPVQPTANKQMENTATSALGYPNDKPPEPAKPVARQVAFKTHEEIIDDWYEKYFAVKMIISERPDWAQNERDRVARAVADLKIQLGIPA